MHSVHSAQLLGSDEESCSLERPLVSRTGHEACDGAHTALHQDIDSAESIQPTASSCRAQHIKRAAARKQQWLAAGHGEYREAATEMDWFAEVRGEERAVCHFYRDSWPCKVGLCTFSLDSALVTHTQLQGSCS